MKKKIAYNIIVSIVAVLIVATLSGVFSSFNNDWYEGLEKSFLSPPNIVFSIVWSALYVALGLGLFFALQKGVNGLTIFYYVLNGTLNILWCMFFFTFKLPVVSFFVLLVNVAVGFLLLFELFKISRLSFWLCLPYCLWLCYALILNYFIIMLN